MRNVVQKKRWKLINSMAALFAEIGSCSGNNTKVSMSSKLGLCSMLITAVDECAMWVGGVNKVQVKLQMEATRKQRGTI